MNQQWRQIVIWLITASISQGCITVHAPLAEDKDYPRSWGNISALGPECKSLEGNYLNEGITTTANGVTQPLLLTSVLNLRSDAQTVALSVRTRKLDQNGDAFITLSVTPDGNLADRHELAGCFCVKQTLACTQINEKYWSVPNLGLGGSQRNVYFSMSHDHALIAKLQNYHADVILAIPLFGKKETWAKFSRVEQ